MKVLSTDILRQVCPVKWHDQIPENGISLGVADVDFKGPEGVTDYLKQNLIDDFSFYQYQQGLSEAVSTATSYLQTKDISARSSNIQIIDGTMMGIYITMKWVSQKPGHLTLLGPIYGPIHNHATKTGNKLNWVKIDPFSGLDVEMLKEKTKEDTKMIVLCNPTNPIGHVFTENELSAISDIVIDNDLFVFSDELYEPLAFGKPHISLATKDELIDRSILLYGFSKAYGLAGYRSGFMHIGPEVETIREIARSIMVSPSPISSLICQYALTDRRCKQWVNQLKKIVKENTKFAAEYFNEQGYKCNIPDGCFFVFPNIEIDDQKFVTYLLNKYGIQVVAGSDFGSLGKKHIRINCATSKERLKSGIESINQAISEMRVFTSKF